MCIYVLKKYKESKYDKYREEAMISMMHYWDDNLTLVTSFCHGRSLSVFQELLWAYFIYF